jgi:hypothetical protein
LLNTYRKQIKFSEYNYFRKHYQILCVVLLRKTYEGQWRLT